MYNKNGDLMKTNLYKEEGYNLIVNETTKFKTIVINIQFRQNIVVEDIPKRAMISSLFLSGTNTYPTKKDISAKMDYLYGANFSSGVSRLGENSIISTKLRIVNPSYVQDDKLLDDSLDVLHDLIFNHSTFEDNKFQEEKRQLINDLISEYDNKTTYALRTIKKHMFKDEMFKYSLNGEIEDYNNLTSTDVFEYYKQMLINDEVTITVSGNIDKDKLSSAIKKRFKFTGKKVNANYIDLEEKDIKKVQEIHEIQDITQAKLAVGLRTYTRVDQDGHYPMAVLNTILGGSSTSFLFSEVREKHNLAYSVSSGYNGHKGYIVMYAGIEPDKFVDCYNVMLEQVSRVINGEFDTDQLESSKKLIISSVRKLEDVQGGMDNNIYISFIKDQEFDTDKIISDISKVTKEQVLNVAKQLKLDTVFLLTNKEVEHVN